MLNFSAFSDVELQTRLKSLLQAEPPNHNPLACHNPATCETCIRWRRWAIQLSSVNKEIHAREKTRS